MNKINVCFMADDALATLKNNTNTVYKKMLENPENTDWLHDLYSGKVFEEKKYKVNEFSLKTSENYADVDYENSITLYENLKDLPRYVLTDERFWAWINFTIGYKPGLHAMNYESKKFKESTVSLHWFFEGGNRRGIFFGALSRCFFRVDLTVDETLSDKYKLTKFVIENPERIRNLTWRSNSSNKNIVNAVVNAELDCYEKHDKKVKSSIYKEIAKFVSLYGSVHLLDVVENKDMYDETVAYIEELIENSNYLEE